MSDLPDDKSLLAGEYVLGALDATEMASVRQQAGADPELASAIAGWERRLAPLASLVPGVVPPPDLWARIDTAIAAEPPKAANDPGGPGLATVTAFPTAPKPRFWQAATAISLALAAAFAAVAFVPREQLARTGLVTTTPPAAPVMQVAALAPLNAPAAVFFAEVQPDGRVKLTALAPVQVPPDRDLQLWLLPSGAAAPTSLGVMPAIGNSVTLPNGPQAGAKLLISLEPRGGSPTGQPTGPVLYGGTLANL